MSNSRDASGDRDSKEKVITKTAGYLVFSGITISILKALIPLNRTRNETRTTNESVNESTQMIRPSQPFSPLEPITKVCIEYEALFTIISSISVVDLFWHWRHPLFVINICCHLFLFFFWRGSLFLVILCFIFWSDPILLLSICRFVCLFNVLLIFWRDPLLVLFICLVILERFLVWIFFTYCVWEIHITCSSGFVGYCWNSLVA